MKLRFSLRTFLIVCALGAPLATLLAWSTGLTDRINQTLVVARSRTTYSRHQSHGIGDYADTLGDTDACVYFSVPYRAFSPVAGEQNLLYVVLVPDSEIVHNTNGEIDRQSQQKVSGTFHGPILQGQLTPAAQSAVIIFRDRAPIVVPIDVPSLQDQLRETYGGSPNRAVLRLVEFVCSKHPELHDAFYGWTEEYYRSRKMQRSKEAQSENDGG